MRRGFSPAATAAFVTTLVVLGLIGWSIGWLAAGADLTAQEQIDPTASVAVTTPPPKSPSPSASPSRVATTSPTPIRSDIFAMPDLVGKKFILARNDAFQAKLGVTVEFGETGKPAGTVVRTVPAQKVYVWPGLTIVLYVAGPPPKVMVPLTAGKACADARDAIVAVGLRIESYPTRELGKVVKTEPVAGTELTWNDPVKVYCAIGAAG